MGAGSYSYRGRVLRLAGGRAVTFRDEIIKVRQAGGLLVVKVRVTGNPDRDALCLCGIDEKGRKVWQFMRGIFSEGYPVVRLYLKGRRLPAGLAKWPGEIEEGVSAFQSSVPPSEPRDTHLLAARGKTLVLPAGRHIRFKHRIVKALELDGVYVVLLAPLTETGLLPVVTCYSNDCRKKWQFTRRNEEWVDIEVPKRKKGGIVRVFSWNGLAIDVNVQDGSVDCEYCAR